MSQKRSSTSAEDVSILSSGVKIEGKLYSEGNVRIDGKLIGDLIVNGNLTLGEGSEINGKVKAQNIAVSGKLEGVATSSEKLILESKAVLKGDISAKILVIEEGAKFDGKSVMEAAAKPSADNK
ncbi:polymer-forming cytoskeletal protein [Bacteroidota bacterium]